VIPLLLMLAAGQTMTPVEAEQAFAVDAQKIGQWTAFRKWSTDDAMMFVPQPVNAHEFLKDTPDPLKAIHWWPTASYMSCDSKLAVNTGGWQRADGNVGYFSTVWKQQNDGGWKWTVDGGDALTAARSTTEPKQVWAACSKPHGNIWDYALSGTHRFGQSPDKTLAWLWMAWPDGQRLFAAAIWTDKGWETVIEDNIPAPSK
jgi:hypothetical protein